jgi:hypothetical protein
MSKLWQFTPGVPNEPGMEEIGRQCRITNGEEMVRVRLPVHGHAPSNFPTARLELTLEIFGLDCFVWGAYAPEEQQQQAFIFASRALRDAMALGPRDVQYFPVDSSFSAPLPRSKDYMIMHLPGVEDISDADRSEYRTTNVNGTKCKFPSRIVFRKGVEPTHEIFRDRFFRDFICTDGLAVRVLQRRCSGMSFADPDYLDYPRRLRSLRGIEEETWDPVQGRSQIKLLRAAPLHLTTVSTSPSRDR